MVSEGNCEKQRCSLILCWKIGSGEWGGFCSRRVGDDLRTRDERHPLCFIGGCRDNCTDLCADDEQH